MLLVVISVLTVYPFISYSGTEKQHVADDYAKRLSIGQMECTALVADVAGTYISGKSGSAPPSFQSCEYLNISICPATAQGNVRVQCLVICLLQNLNIHVDCYNHH